MTTTIQATRNEFIGNIYKAARELTTREITGTKAWVIGLEIKAFADSYDISDLTAEFLDNELNLRKSHYFLDGHNWSDLARGIANTSIQIIEILSARKERVGA